MSSLYVREKLREWCRTAPGIVLPYFDTVNIEQRPTVPRWATLNFVASFSSKITYCGDIEETGTFDYVALGAAGVGDVDLITAAENDIAILLAQVDRRLTLLRATPPDDFLQAGSVPWYTVSMVVDYTYQRPAAAA